MLVTPRVDGHNRTAPRESRRRKNSKMVDIDRRNTNLTVAQVSRAASSNDWGIPEFQREFVWAPGRVASLAKSLLAGWSMSCWHTWHPKKNKEEIRHRTSRVELDQADIWVLDGQQRLTSVALITGRQPAWYTDQAWTRLLQSHAPSLDLRALEREVFTVGMPREAAPYWLPFPMLFEGAKVLQKELNSRGYGPCYALAAEAAARIDQYQIPIVTLQNTAGSEVVEQFRLLNQQSTRVPPASIRQGVMSVMVPGFTVDFAEPLRTELATAGWPIRPTTIIDSFLDLAGVRRVEAIDPEEVPQLIKRCETAWRRTIDYLARTGIHGLSCWPAERMLRGLVMATDTWPEAHKDNRLSNWVICALWDGHQSVTDQLVQDLAIIRSGRKAESTWADVISELSARLDPTPRTVKPNDLIDIKSSPNTTGSNGARERMLYAITYPEPPLLTKTAKVPVWVPLNDYPGGLTDWTLTLGTTRSAQPAVDTLTDADRKRQLAALPHSTTARSKTLAAAMNTTLESVGTKTRPSRR
jgi:hypothetical protein